MARDRKRAKQRRQRQQAGRPRPTERVPSRGAGTPAPNEEGPAGGTPAPDPLDDASGEVEQVEAAVMGGAPVADDSEPISPEELPQPDELGSEDDELPEVAGGRAGLPVRGGEPSKKEGGRLANFLRACWRELQRVQWPDRRAVAQATGVVLGFVVIAGGYLGLLDAVWSRFIDAIV